MTHSFTCSESLLYRYAELNKMVRFRFRRRKCRCLVTTRMQGTLSSLLIWTVCTGLRIRLCFFKLAHEQCGARVAGDSVSFTLKGPSFKHRSVHHCYKHPRQSSKFLFHTQSTTLESTFRDPILHPPIGLDLSDRLHVRHRRTDLLHLGGTKVGHPRRLRGTSAKAPDSLVSPGQRAEELEQLDGRLYTFTTSAMIHPWSIQIYSRSWPSRLPTRAPPCAPTAQTNHRMERSGGRCPRGAPFV